MDNFKTFILIMLLWFATIGILKSIPTVQANDIELEPFLKCEGSTTITKFKLTCTQLKVLKVDEQ